VRTIEDSSSKMKKKKVEVEELELSLDQEEKVLEGIRDSLKGNPRFVMTSITC
jgi:structural maintenance of chromosome 4